MYVGLTIEISRRNTENRRKLRLLKTVFIRQCDVVRQSVSVVITKINYSEYGKYVGEDKEQHRYENHRLKENFLTRRLTLSADIKTRTQQRYTFVHNTVKPHANIAKNEA